MTNIDYSRYYLRFHNDSDEHFIAQGDLDAAFPLRVAPHSQSALDIGCGMGFVVGGLRRGGIPLVLGIDSSPEQIAAAKRRGLEAELVPAESTVDFLRARQGQFDLVTCIDVLEHIPPEQVINVLAGAYGALKPGGVFFCRAPNALSPIVGRQLFNDWTHYKAFTEHSLDFVLFNGGFKHIQILAAEDAKLSLGGIPGWIARRISRGFMRVALGGEIGWRSAWRAPMTPNIVGVATK